MKIKYIQLDAIKHFKSMVYSFCKGASEKQKETS